MRQSSYKGESESGKRYQTYRISSPRRYTKTFHRYTEEEFHRGMNAGTKYVRIVAESDTKKKTASDSASRVDTDKFIEKREENASRNVSTKKGVEQFQRSLCKIHPIHMNSSKIVYIYIYIKVHQKSQKQRKTKGRYRCDWGKSRFNTNFSNASNVFKPNWSSRL